MKMKRWLILWAFYALLMGGCGGDDLVDLREMNKTIKRVTKSATQHLPMVREVNVSEVDILEKMGLHFEDEKIVIDLNQTNHFFEGLEKKANQKAQSLERALDEINISKEAGVLVQKSKVAIDLNKTKNLLDNISHIFENILFDANRTNR